ncbi:hypothetical protein HOG98_09185 [bacterium]|jgi:transposase, IS6 family|nr:hypothetical protein [bacterium]
MSLRRKHHQLQFKWRNFETEIILLSIRWYLSYRLSYKYLVEIMDERGLKTAYTPIKNRK